MIVNMIISLFIATCLQWNPQSIAATISKALITGILSKGATTYLDPDDITIQLNGDVIGTKVYIRSGYREGGRSPRFHCIHNAVNLCMYH